MNRMRHMPTKWLALLSLAALIAQQNSVEGCGFWAGLGPQEGADQGLTISMQVNPGLRRLCSLEHPPSKMKF